MRLFVAYMIHLESNKIAIFCTGCKWIEQNGLCGRAALLALIDFAVTIACNQGISCFISNSPLLHPWCRVLEHFGLPWNCPSESWCYHHLAAQTQICTAEKPYRKILMYILSPMFQKLCLIGRWYISVRLFVTLIVEPVNVWLRLHLEMSSMKSRCFHRFPRVFENQHLSKILVFNPKIYQHRMWYSTDVSGARAETEHIFISVVLDKS